MDSLSLVARSFRRGLALAIALLLIGAWLVAVASSTTPSRLLTVPGFSGGSCIDPQGCPYSAQGPTVDPNGLAAGGAMDPNGALYLLASGSAIDPDGLPRLLVAGCGIDPNGSCHPTGQVA